MACMWLVLRASVLWRVVCVCALLVSAHMQPAFDTSAALVRMTLPPGAGDAYWDAWAAPFVRWDAIYFVALAHPERGYMYENTLAFQPGIVHVLRVFGYLPTFWGDLRWSSTYAVLGAACIANLLTCIAPVLLYRLTQKQTKSAALAERAALLAVLAPASSTSLSAPTPEPFYSFLALCGYNLLDQGAWGLFGASVCFASATYFRANGVLLAGFVVWYALRSKSLGVFVVGIVGAFLMASPFLLHQVWAYMQMCPGRPWCDSPLPLAYSFVQSHYWDVGLLRYWTLAQLPNFLLAAPVLVMAAYGCYAATPSLQALIVSAFAPWRRFPPQGLSCVPVYIYHTLLLALLLLLASHVQIALRMATPGGMPLVWWACAHLGGTQTRGVLTYLLCYSAAACVLYAGFYPPA